MDLIFKLLPLVLGAANNPQLQALLPLITNVLTALGQQTFPGVDPAKAASAGASLFDIPNTKWAQVGLSLLGHYKGEIDGIPGTGTKDAVKAYQTSKNGALVVDGWAGTKTVESMQKELLGK